MYIHISGFRQGFSAGFFWLVRQMSTCGGRRKASEIPFRGVRARFVEVLAKPFAKMELGGDGSALLLF